MRELQLSAPIGDTWYAIIFYGADQVVSGTSLVTYSSSNWASYAIALSDPKGIGEYVGDFPVVPAGVYDVRYYIRQGATPASSDAPAGGVQQLVWTGTSEAPPPGEDAGDQGACNLYYTARKNDNSIEDGVDFYYWITKLPSGANCNGEKVRITSVGTSANNVAFTLQRGAQGMFQRDLDGVAQKFVVPDLPQAQLADWLEGGVIGLELPG